MELWERERTGGLNSPRVLPDSTDKPQGPFPLSGGGSGFILPLPPTPAAVTTPAAAPGGPQSSLDPPSYAPGRFSSFPAQDLNALSYGEPPDIAADLSPTQNVEFVNYLGMYVYNKPTLPIASPAPASDSPR